MPDIQRSAEVASFRTVTEGRFHPINSIFRIRNTGNTHVDLQATITLNSSSGPLLQEIRLLDKDTRILPGATRTFTVTHEQGLESGSYTADLTVRAGGGNIEYAHSSFRIY